MEKCYNFNTDNEWYTFKSDVEKFIDFIGLEPNIIFNSLLPPYQRTIWCPFDKEDSAFVQVLKEKGFNVIHSHIDEGKDFYEYEPTEHYDYIISNPPFQHKDKTMQRLIELKKPFALIFGIQCFSSGTFIATLNQLDHLQFVLVPNRMKFHKGVEDTKLPAPSFHSMWICNGITNTYKQILIMPHELKNRKKVK